MKKNAPPKGKYHPPIGTFHPVAPLKTISMSTLLQASNDSSEIYINKSHNYMACSTGIAY
jgi:hypothetical protein